MVVGFRLPLTARGSMNWRLGESPMESSLSMEVQHVRQWRCNWEQTVASMNKQTGKSFIENVSPLLKIDDHSFTMVNNPLKIVRRGKDEMWRDQKNASMYIDLNNAVSVYHYCSVNTVNGVNVPGCTAGVGSLFCSLLLPSSGSLVCSLPLPSSAASSHSSPIPHHWSANRICSTISFAISAHLPLISCGQWSCDNLPQLPLYMRWQFVNCLNCLLSFKGKLVSRLGITTCCRL